jgi:hypothetical protein
LRLIVDLTRLAAACDGRFGSICGPKRENLVAKPASEHEIGYKLGIIEGRLENLHFEESLVLALKLLRRAWHQFAGEFELSDSFGDPRSLFQTHARLERGYFLDLMGGSPWAPMRRAVYYAEKLCRKEGLAVDQPAMRDWHIPLAAAIEAIQRQQVPAPLDCLTGAISQLVASVPAFSEGRGAAIIRTIGGSSFQGYQGASPSAAWAFNLASLLMSEELGLGSHTAPLPSLARRELFRMDMSDARRRSLMADALLAGANAFIHDIDESVRSAASAEHHLRNSRRNSRAADAYIFFAGIGELSHKELAVLLKVSLEGARKIVAQLVRDGFVTPALSGNRFVSVTRLRVDLSHPLRWETSISRDAPSIRNVGES